MADGRHFENSIFPHISPENYPISIKFGRQMWISVPMMVINKKSKFYKFKIADERHIENRFWLCLGAILAD